jgi:hypothetical protein
LDSSTGLSTFDGLTVTGTDVLMKFTYYGDANLDGKVDGSDYSKIDNGYLTHGTGWSNGDFNYDGVVNGSDYTLIDNAFNTQGPAIPAAEIAAVTATVTSPARKNGKAQPALTATAALQSETPTASAAASASSIEVSLQTKDKLDGITTFSDRLLP